MIDEEFFLEWLKTMVKRSSQYHNDMYFAGATKTYQMILDLINAGTFAKK